MLSKKMIDRLNSQLNLEFYSSNLYLQMSSWCENSALEGSGEFLRKHALEEMHHMLRLFTYINETGAMAVIGKIKAPRVKYDSVKDVFAETYQHECVVTKAINDLAHTAYEDRDYSTFNFLQWYVAEQHEEEKLFKTILDKIDLIGEDKQGLFFIDQELKTMAAEKVVPELVITSE